MVAATTRTRGGGRKGGPSKSKSSPSSKTTKTFKGKPNAKASSAGAGAGGTSNNKSNDKKRITPKKPSARVQRLLKAKEPKVVEDAKNVLLLKGTKCPGVMQTVLKDLVC